MRKLFTFGESAKALEAAEKVGELSNFMDHKPHIQFKDKDHDGVGLEISFPTNTESRYSIAKAIDVILGVDKDAVQMNRFSYNLEDTSIAKYPASPRGSSKLLHRNESGGVKYYKNFSQSFLSLVEGCHFVFNDSRVLDARLYVKDADGAKIELMLLDLGCINVKDACKDNIIQAMLRKTNLEVGSEFEVCGGGLMEIVDIKGIWEEDEKSDGNGIECFVRLKNDMSIEKYLERVGSVPIPPYLHRSSEATDKNTYNNTYAANSGSVAAPTAGKITFFRLISSAHKF